MKENWQEIYATAKQRLVFDCDSVIADPGDPWREYKDREPYPFVKKKLDKLKDLGYHISILTARYMERCDGDQNKATEKGYLELKNWLEKHEIPYDELYFGKPSGVIYVDDRGFYLDSSRGEGHWDLLFNKLGI